MNAVERTEETEKFINPPKNRDRFYRALVHAYSDPSHMAHYVPERFIHDNDSDVLVMNTNGPISRNNKKPYSEIHSAVWTFDHREVPHQIEFDGNFVKGRVDFSYPDAAVISLGVERLARENGIGYFIDRVNMNSDARESSYGVS